MSPIFGAAVTRAPVRAACRRTASTGTATRLRARNLVAVPVEAVLRHAARTGARVTAAPKIGLMLYTIRDECASDFEASLRTVADLGFDGLELFDLHRHGPSP